MRSVPSRVETATVVNTDRKDRRRPDLRLRRDELRRCGRRAIQNLHLFLWSEDPGSASWKEVVPSLVCSTKLRKGTGAQGPPRSTQGYRRHGVSRHRGDSWQLRPLVRQRVVCRSVRIRESARDVCVGTLHRVFPVGPKHKNQKGISDWRHHRGWFLRRQVPVTSLVSDSRGHSESRAETPSGRHPETLSGNGRDSELKG